MKHQLILRAELVPCEDMRSFQIQYYLGQHVVPFADPISAAEAEDITGVVSRVASMRMAALKAFLEAVFPEQGVNLPETFEGEVN